MGMIETILTLYGAFLYLCGLASLVSFKHYQASLDSWNNILTDTIENASKEELEDYYKNKVVQGSLSWMSYFLWESAVLGERSKEIK